MLAQILFLYFFFFSGQVVPPAATPDSDSPSSDSPSHEQHSKFMLVMSGGEGYIDFRTGKNTTNL